MTETEQRIKSVLDRNCRRKPNHRSYYTNKGKAADLAKLTECFVCHKHDDLAHEIAEEIERMKA